MEHLQVAFSRQELKAYVQPSGDMPPTGTVVLGTFYHDEGDTLSNEGNHVLYHHVQEILYKNGYENMQWVQIMILEPEIRDSESIL